MTKPPYRLDDTQVSHLKALYDSKSKHGAYHALPSFLSAALGEQPLDKLWRDVSPRIRLLESEIRRVNRTDTTFVELGSNTGGQILQLATAFPDNHFVALELNANHLDFTKEVAKIVRVSNVEFHQGEFSPREASRLWPRAVFYDFNVAHHMGSDFQSEGADSVSSWWKVGLPYWLKCRSEFTEYWFSAGYRLGGNKSVELHSPNDPAGFSRRVLEAAYDADGGQAKLYFAQRKAEHLEYVPWERRLNWKLNKDRRARKRRSEFQGEYFARPLFQFTG